MKNIYLNNYNLNVSTAYNVSGVYATFGAKLLNVPSLIFVKGEHKGEPIPVETLQR